MIPKQVSSPEASSLVDRLTLEDDGAKRQRLYHKVDERLELIRSLKAEVDHYKDKDSARALHLGMCALELSKLTEHPEAKPLGLWAYALGLTVQGRFEEALGYFDRARALYCAQKRKYEAARVAVRQIQALAMTGALEEAVRLADDTRNTFHEYGYEQDALAVEINMGIIYRRLGQFSRAEEVLEHTLVGFDAAGDLAKKVLVYISLGNVCQEQDLFAKAEHYFKLALELAQSLGQDKHVAGTTVNLALLYRGMGRHHEALKLLTQVRKLYEQLPAGPDAALAQLEEARIHLDLNLLSEAVAIATELIEVFGEKEMTLEQTEALQVLGLAQARRGELALAMKTLGAARKQWCVMGNRVQTSLTDLSIASLHLELNDFTQAQVLAQKAVSLLEELGTPSGHGYLLCADILLAQELLLEAQAYLVQAEQDTQSDVPELRFRALYLKGKIAAKQKQLEQAKTHFKKAIECLESAHGALPVADFRAAYIEDKFAVYERLISLLAREGDVEGVFEYTERAKSRALLDLLGDDVDTSYSDPQAIAVKEKLTQARAALNAHVIDADSKCEQRLAKEHEVTHLLRDLERLKPESSPFDKRRIPTLSDLQMQLDARTAWVTYFSCDGTLSALVVTSTGTRYVQALAPEKDVRESFEWLEFYFNRAALGEAFVEAYGEQRLYELTHQPLQALYNMLIAPLELGSAVENLILCPHGFLFNVPFAALFDGQSYLGDHCRVSLVPGASVYFHCRQQTRKPKASLRAFGMSRDLPNVGRELRMIGRYARDAELYLDAEASLATFTAQAPEAEVLHLATHGDFRPDNPVFSSLRLHDGSLNVRDLYGAKLEASLVVLSACHSGRVSRFYGDELVGLARGFLEAGASTLVSTLWPTKDAQTAQFMSYFYEGLSKDLSVAEALNGAQCRLREDYPNPYYWAAFSVMGDASRAKLL